MIDYIKGKLISKNSTSIVLEVNNIAFSIKIPASTYQAIGEIGEDIKIFTNLSLKNEKIEIFGFASEEEKNLFIDLTGVQGIGGGMALKIMSNIRIDEFKSLIARGEKKALSEIKGIGPNTAEKLIFGLRGKYKETLPSAREDAIRAVVSLGFKREEVEKVIAEIKSESTEELIKEALKRL